MAITDEVTVAAGLTCT